MTEHQIQLALQIVPLDREKNTYKTIDAAIAVIQQSGLTYMVTPMETVIQGSYEAVSKVAREAQAAVAAEGCNEFLVNIKMHVRLNGDVTMEEKKLNR